MSLYSEALERASVRNFVQFLLYGEGCIPQSGVSCERRLKESDRAIGRWLTEQFPDGKEREKAADTVWNAFIDSNEAHMELGLIAGFQIAMGLKEEWLGRFGASQNRIVCRPRRKAG